MPSKIREWPAWPEFTSEEAKETQVPDISTPSARSQNGTVVMPFVKAGSKYAKIWNKSPKRYRTRGTLLSLSLTQRRF
jgi:hypothetical protein